MAFNAGLLEIANQVGLFHFKQLGYALVDSPTCDANDLVDQLTTLRLTGRFDAQFRLNLLHGVEGTCSARHEASTCPISPKPVNEDTRVQLLFHRLHRAINSSATLLYCSDCLSAFCPETS